MTPLFWSCCSRPQNCNPRYSENQVFRCPEEVPASTETLRCQGRHRAIFAGQLVVVFVVIKLYVEVSKVLLSFLSSKISKFVENGNLTVVEEA